MNRKTFIVLNGVLVAMVAVGVPTFPAMPSAVATGWMLATIGLAGFVVYHGFRRFFASENERNPDVR